MAKRSNRRKAPLFQTYLCAVKFWSGSYPASGRAGYRGPTLIRGVRHVVRKQGFASRDIYKTERDLEQGGLIEIGAKGPGQGVRLTERGRSRARCKSVKLAPWTDPQYPGAQLSGGRCKYGRTKRGTCRVRPKRRR